MNRYARIFLVLIALVPAAFAQTLQGAGSSLPYPLYSKWIEHYHKLHSTVKIHYQPVGPNAGITDLLAGKVDFAASDTPLDDQQLQALKAKFGSDVLQIPTALSAVVPIYRIDGVNAELKFTSAALAGIYLGTVTMWDDSAIADANPNVSLPNKKIVVIHRSDSSETTYQWTAFLSRVSPEWKSGPGTGLTVKWPVGHGVKEEDGMEDLVIGPTGNYGTADLLSGLSNSIGYIQFRYAIENELPYGDVQSESGGFVRAAQSSVLAAANADRAHLRSIENQPGVGLYPIASVVWLVVPVKLSDEAKTKAMADFLKWALTDGQSISADLHYVVLPIAVVDRALAEIVTIP